MKELEKNIQSIEKTLNEEVAHLQARVYLLSERLNILEMKLKNTLKSQEDLPHENIVEPQGKKANSDIKEIIVSENKANVFHYEQCEV